MRPVKRVQGKKKHEIRFRMLTDAELPPPREISPPKVTVEVVEVAEELPADPLAIGLDNHDDSSD